MRQPNYALAINEALHQMMEADESVFLIGQGVKSPWYVGNTAKDLLERFGLLYVERHTFLVDLEIIWLIVIAVYRGKRL